ncbi:type VI secretion protein [Gallaecimonas kandeliae]|uniref:type VI secretion protein n=1 Tax=Gallaecimonas kandeliae TaxID=3029055 RepID=UPI002647DD68|nr:type VI secretion protein [Gallaecimonas kandeliae]WKE64478.1 type VI secretion protein [Gallaecimonas kandeliae]
MPKGLRTAVAAALTLLLTLPGCSMFSPSTPLSTISLDVVPKANNDSPVAVDILVVADSDLLKTLLALPAAKWFEQRAQFLRDYPQQLHSWSYELVPGQRLVVDPVPFEGDEAVGVLVYADYQTPGAHRLRLEGLEDAKLRLESKDIRLVANKD